MQLDEILFSFLREVIQEKNLEDLKEVIKRIFKLLKCLIYRSKNVQEKIQENFLSFKNLENLYNLGYLSLVCEEIKVNYKFAIENSDFILQLIKNRLQPSNINNIHKNYERIMAESQTILRNNKKNCKRYNLAELEVKNKCEFKFEHFYNVFKELNKILKIMNYLLNIAKDEKYQKIILEIYLNLIKDFQEKKFLEIECHSTTPEIQKFELIHYKVRGNIIRIGYSFIKNNENLRTIIKKLIPKDYLEDQILYMKWKYKLQNSNTQVNVQNIFNEIKETKESKEPNLSINDEKKKSHSMNLELKIIKSQTMLKYYGCKLYAISFNEYQRTKDLTSIKSKFKRFKTK